MQLFRHPGDVVRFGPFEVDLEERVLRKNGVRVRLQAQPFQVLAALLEKPGAAVTRDELRRRVWPEHTFVDFEHGLNAAVTRLRQALGDSADKPRYIETLPKHGYRFSAQVEGSAVEIQPEDPSKPVAPPKRRAAIWIVAMALAIAAGSSVLLILNSHRADPQVGRLVPLTTFRGREAHPALSPDGSQVAFTWNGENQDNFDIYVMQIGSDAPFRLTSDPADDVSPAWSPDGRTLAFMRRLGHDRGELLLVPTTGGAEHKLREIRNQELRESPPRLMSLAWSPDGRWIAASHRAPVDSSERIYLFPLNGEARPLTSLAGSNGDHMPAFSSDGRALAFSRLLGHSASEIRALPLHSGFQPAGEARRLATGKPWSVNPAWTRDGSGILYLSADEPAGRHELRTIAASGKHTSPQTIPLSDEASAISLGRHLVYSRQLQDTNIWRARVSPPGRAPVMAELFISSTRRDDKPRYSPDGKKIGFTSLRSGSSEIWVSKADGSNPVRMTSFGRPLVGYMNWSPDGQWIVFHARPEGQADVFVIPASGGSPKRLTTNMADDTMPSYSHDGRWIYFSSARSGQTQIWRMAAAGGAPVQLTTSGGHLPIESADGKAVYYIAPDGSGIRSVPFSGGESATVVGPIHGYPSGFAVTAEGIYYPAPPHSGKQRFIRFFSFSTRQSRPVAIASYAFYFGMSVSPDSKYVVFDQYDVLGSDLMLVENFRIK